MQPHPAPRPYPNPPAAEVVTPPPAKELSVNKILAGAGAAATTAVLGSYFGAAGTVAGAALGSVASTVATTIYQRSLDRTSKTIVARIRPVAGADPGATAPMPRLPSDEATVQLRVEPVVPPAPPRRRWMVWVGATVLVFLLGLLAVTGIEWIKGSAVTSGDPGTSVGRVLGADPGTTAPTEDPTSDTTGESTADPTSSADPSATPSSTAEPDAGRSGSGTESTRTPSTSTTSAPGLGGLLPGQPGTRG